jgi:hypothetical protein
MTRRQLTALIVSLTAALALATSALAAGEPKNAAPFTRSTATPISVQGLAAEPKHRRRPAGAAGFVRALRICASLRSRNRRGGGLHGGGCTRRIRALRRGAPVRPEHCLVAARERNTGGELPVARCSRRSSGDCGPAAPGRVDSPGGLAQAQSALHSTRGVTASDSPPRSGGAAPGVEREARCAGLPFLTACFLAYAGAGSPGRASSSVSAIVSLRPASVARTTSSAASDARARSTSSRPTGLSP